MARRKSRKSGRFTKSTRTRRKSKLNIVNAAVSLAVANSVSQNVAGVNLRDFIFAGTQFSELHASGWNYADSAADGRNPYNAIITLNEIFRNRQGGKPGDRTSPFAQMTTNLKANIIPLTMGVIGIPIIAKVATKLLRKPMLTPMNRMLKMTGLDVKV
jgi:hypothetical protein